jgi:hypothetical protein
MWGSIAEACSLAEESGAKQPVVHRWFVNEYGRF